MAIKNERIPLTDSERHTRLLDAIGAVEINIDAYLNGKRPGWLAVGSQLFILLCDPNPSSSLIGALLPHIAFLPLSTQILQPKSKDDETWLMHSPAPVHFEPGRITVELFDSSKAKMPMGRWLRQVIGVHNYGDESHYVTIAQLIYYARNQMGAAHLDAKWDRVAKSLEHPQLHANGTVYPFYEWALILIGHVVVSEAKLALHL